MAGSTPLTRCGSAWLSALSVGTLWRAVLHSLVLQVLLVVFAAELLLKVVAYGFVIGETAYLKSQWNKIDFIVVLAGMIDQIAGVFLPSDDPSLVRILCFCLSCCHADLSAELHSHY